MGRENRFNPFMLESINDTLRETCKTSEPFGRLIEFNELWMEQKQYKPKTIPILVNDL